MFYMMTIELLNDFDLFISSSSCQADSIWVIT